MENILSAAEEILGAAVRVERHRDWAIFWCPFHNDASREGEGGHPNFGVNLINGYWKCLRCGATGGSLNALRIKLGQDWKPPVSVMTPTRPPKPPSQVSNAIRHPEILLAGARDLVAELINEVDNNDSNRERIQKELENLFLNRQWTITQARMGNISEEEMERTLNEYSQQEVSLKSELSGMQKRIDEQLLVDWEAKVMEFLADLQDGIQALSDLSVSEEEWLESFDLKKRIVQFLVERVTIDVHRQLTVTIHLNLMELLEESLKKNDGGSGSSGVWPTGGSPAKSDSHRKPSMFAGRSGYISISAIWNN